MSRTILIIGNTGKGKSTIANVITGTELFQEGFFSVSQTRHHQVEEVTIDGLVFRIVDTIGVNDTGLPAETVLYRIADACASVREGINQVYWVVGERFTPEELILYDLLRTVIFNDDVIPFTTIIRTKFAHFRNPAMCEQDKQLLLRENPQIAEVVNRCRMIHVNNMSEVEEPALTCRAECQTKLRVHLRTCDRVYHPDSLDAINARVAVKLDEERAVDRQLAALKDEVASLNRARDEILAQAQRQQRDYAAQIAGMNQQMTETRNQLQRDREERDRQAAARKAESDAAIAQAQARQQQLEQEKSALQAEIAHRTHEHIAPAGRRRPWWEKTFGGFLGRGISSAVSAVKKCSIM